jgi:serine protease Do
MKELEEGFESIMWRFLIILVFLLAAGAGYYSGLVTATTKLVTPDEINTVEIRQRSLKAVVTVYAKIPPEQRQPGEDEEAIGTGFFYKPNLIVTNFHVVQDALSWRIQLYDGRSFPAELESIDQGIDIAILKVSKITAPGILQFGNSLDILPGQKAIAIGSPSGKRNSISVGVVRSFARITEFSDETGTEIPEMLLTDAQINAGNSGGPLLDSKGNVIAIVDAFLDSGVAATGIGLTIPSNLAKESLSDLEKSGVSQRGQLGATLRNLSEFDPIVYKQAGLNSDRGAMIEDIEPGSAAGKANLRKALLNPNGKVEQLGDVILKVGNEAVKDKYDVIQRIAQNRPGKGVQLTIWRDKKLVVVKVIVQPRQASR